MSAPGSARHRILVIDDNRAIHEDFRKILGPNGAASASLAEAEAAFFGQAPAAVEDPSFEIDSAYQGKEGLAMVQEAVARQRPYALAFVDVRMPPGWDGVETITHLWQAYPELQVVICTAYSDYSWEQIANRLGHSDRLVILKKPFDNIEVLQLAHTLTTKWVLAQAAACRLEQLEGLVAERTSELQAANAQLQTELAEKARTAEALRASEERFSKAFSASPMPMAIQLLETGRYLDANEAFLHTLDLQLHEVLEHTPSELDLWVDEAPYQEALAQVQDALPVRARSCQLRTRKQGVREALLWMERMQLGQDAHILSIIEDVSERLQLERRLSNAQKMQAVGQLAAGIAHDFNNLLTVIQGNVGLALATADLDDDVETALEEVAAASQRAGALTRQLLTFSRKQVMQPKAVNLNQVIRNLMSMLSRVIGEHIELHCDYAEDLPCLSADECNVEQVIMNLAINARDAMPTGGRLELRTEQVELSEAYGRRNPEAYAGKFVCFSVKDTGCGMDATVLNRIFEPFFTTKAVGKGTGLGLATVYGIVKQHRGWVEVNSQPGQGSTFRVFLPAGNGTGKRIEPVIAALPEPGTARRILVVEDEPAVRSLVRRILSDHGYDVIEASNGVEAQTVWAQSPEHVDLLLTDMVMPEGIGGLELARRLLAQDPALKVICTSGYSADIVGENSLQNHGVSFLPKPYVPVVLLGAVHRALAAQSPGQDASVSAQVSA